MSAFVVDKHHVDVLVKAALCVGRGGDPGYAEKFQWWRVDENGDYAGWRKLDPFWEGGEQEDDGYSVKASPSELGQILVSENVRSVMYRYQDTTGDGDLPGPCDAFYMAPYVYTDPERKLSPGEVFKAIDCLDYQSCETPDWRKTEAHAVLVALRDAYCRMVEGYSDAPWEFHHAR